MITREEATLTLTAIVYDENLDPGLRAQVDDILTAIHYERIGLHLWGVPDEEIETIEDFDKYVFGASDFESEEIQKTVDKLETDGDTISDDYSEDNTEVDKSTD